VTQYTSGLAVRTNIVIDDALLQQVQELTGARTKREAVDTALRLLVQIKRQEAIRAARGKLRWEGDLEAMRRDT
jgi:Arc/MetJ family transcription regulator